MADHNTGQEAEQELGHENKIGEQLLGFDNADTSQLIVFKVGVEVFALHIDDVQEILKAGVVTPIPDSPPFMAGLINVRGNIISVIDLRSYLNLSEEEEINDHIIVTRDESNVFGLLVDEVSEVRRVNREEIKRPPKLLTSVHDDYVKGVIAEEAALIIVLDIEKVLSDDELTKMDISARQKMASDSLDKLKREKQAKMRRKANKKLQKSESNQKEK